MIAVARGAALGANNPLLSEWTAVNGVLGPPESLTWSIYDVSTGAKESVPVLVEGPTAVDLTDDLVSTGHYAAAWTVPADQALGRHQIRWSAVLVEDGPTVTWTRDFEVVANESLSLAGCYLLLCDMREEGVTTTMAGDMKLARRIFEASEIIRRYTGRTFEPHAATVRVDGTGNPALDFHEPIIAVDTITINDAVIDSTIRVYNRHLGTSAVEDDRNAPRIERVASIDNWAPTATMVYPYNLDARIASPWPYGQQNITVSGVWGYTDRDGSPSGKTPELIKRATKLIVVRNLAKLTDTDANFDARNRHRLVSERTREQSYQLSDGGKSNAIAGHYTGDPEIDQILEAYARPPYVGST